MTSSTTQQFVRVALDVPLPRLFDYAVKTATRADIGRRVIVPFANRKRLGVIIDVLEHSSVAKEKMKWVEEILEDIPALSQPLLELFYFCSDYYHYPLGQVIFTALPTRLRQTKKFKPHEVHYFQALEDFSAHLPAKAVVQQRLAAHLLNPSSETELKRISPLANRYLERWVTAGYIKRVLPTPVVLEEPLEGITLTKEQTYAVDALKGVTTFQSFLLYGVTGSGKTEVYLESIAEYLFKSLQVLVLVPEINLTPQLEARFKARFPNARIASLHSEVSDKVRADVWVQAERGEVDIVLGTRLAVFTPFPRLGLIVVDEEHDASFKQQDNLRYHARDVAVFRAKLMNIPIILGSATPALESWHNAKQGRYHLLTLTQRATAQLPDIQLISTENTALVDGLHPHLLKSMDQALANGEQVLVFLNRRGYAPVLHCQQCGWNAPCQRCSSRLTVHLRIGRVKCHLCGYEASLPRACPSCGNTDIKPVGQGTQRLETALKVHFPNYEVIRVDRDSMARKGSWAETFHRVKKGRGQMLIGTQMLAKGHDFPNLGLAVILNTDAALYSADFRAEERLFSQLMQVAGRVGRADIPGRVFVQTLYTQHPLYLSLAQYDYAPFADRLLEDRKLMHFPPYCFQAILRADAHDIKRVIAFLTEAKELAPLYEVTVYDPVPALIQKLAGLERAQLLIQASNRTTLHRFITEWLVLLRALKQHKIRWVLEIDPIEV